MSMLAIDIAFHYREELAVIRRVPAAYEEHDKLRREKWIRERSKAAVAGTAVFQKLGGAIVSGFGADPVVTMLTRRRDTVERKLLGKKESRRVEKVPAKPRVRKDRLRENRDEEKRKDAAIRKEKEERQRTKDAAEQRRQEVKRQKAEKAAQLRQEVARKVEAEVARKEEASAAKKEEAAAARKAKEDATKKAAMEKKRPSLFVITLGYLAPLEKIDAAMADHMAFLDKHYKKGDFMVSGRQEPRVGGIILSSGKDRREVERMMQGDPLVKRGLAKVEVVEFKASQVGKELHCYFGPK